MIVLVRQLRQETGCTGASTAHTFDFQQVTHGVHWRVQVGETPRPLLTILNVSTHRSTASVPITILLYSVPLLCGFNVPIYIALYIYIYSLLNLLKG